MENVKNDIIEDAILLCDKAIRTKDDNEDFKRGFREISIEKVFQTLFEGEVLYYKNSKTPDFLQGMEIIDMDDFFSDTRNVQKRRSKGYFEVAFDYEKARKWMNGVIRQSLSKPSSHIIIPNGKDHLYENGILYIALQNRTPDVLDLTNSPMVKPIFDSFYNLYKNSTTPFFSEIELLNEYEKNNYEKIEWTRFIEGVSDIKKRINKKKTLKQRVILEFDRKEQKYRFEILPLTSSDK